MAEVDDPRAYLEAISQKFIEHYQRILNGLKDGEITDEEIQGHIDDVEINNPDIADSARDQLEADRNIEGELSEFANEQTDRWLNNYCLQKFGTPCDTHEKMDIAREAHLAYLFGALKPNQAQPHRLSVV